MSVLHGLKWKVNKMVEKPFGRYIYRRVSRTKNFPRIQDNGAKEKIIVSLTSFPPRFSTLPLCLKSILLQSRRPDKLIVWFGSDVKENAITEDMRELEKYGVEYRFDEQLNLKPHKKYFYAMQEYNDSVVITIDDDVIYPRKMIEKLLRKHRKYPKAVCAGRVHKITYTAEKKIASYTQWQHMDDLVKGPSYELVAIGIGGVLYPPHCLDERAFRADDILAYCLDADDMWLKCASYVKGTKVVGVPNASRFLYTMEEAQKVALCDTNVNENRNDIFLKSAMEYFGIKDGDFLIDEG